MEHAIEITGLAFGGKGVGRIEGKVVFVPFTAPGDIARVRVVADRKSYYEGELAGLVTPSPDRCEPVCPHFGVCGGCSLQHMTYPSQIRWKQEILAGTLKRIGGVEPAFDGPTQSPGQLNYRSRASFHVSKGAWGFFETASHSVVDIDDCPILDKRLNQVYREVKQALQSASGEGYIKAMDIGVSDNGTAAAAFFVSSRHRFDWRGALSGIAGLAGFEVWLAPSKKGKGRRINAEYDSRLIYSAGGLRFEAGISVFTQVNRPLNDLLIKRVVECASLSGSERVADLCSGVGNLSLPLAKGALFVTGVEQADEAVEFARKNAELNNIGNAGFVCSDSLGWALKGGKNLEKKAVDMVVLDPPRGGDRDVARAMAALRPSKIVYVSCSPPTLARDLSLLTGSGYGVFRAGLFDMFPQTYHIECVAGLELPAQ